MIKPENGKGSAQRPYNKDKFNEGYDAIWGNNKDQVKDVGRTIKSGGGSKIR